MTCFVFISEKNRRQEVISYFANSNTICYTKLHLMICPIKYHTRVQKNTIPYHTIPYHTIPYHTIPYHTILCHAMPCHAMPCHAIPHIPCHTTPHTPHHTTHNTTPHTTPHHTTPHTIPLGGHRIWNFQIRPDPDLPDSDKNSGRICRI